jgi:hypothetical protein
MASDIKIPNWSPVQQETQRFRMIIASSGENRMGRTTFGLDAPGPIACFPFDNNTKELIQKTIKTTGKTILTPNEPLDYIEATKQEEWKPIWNYFEQCWEDAVASPSIRTIMADTFTEANELARLAEFGKLSGEIPRHYEPINAKFKRIIDLTYRTDKNVILIHRVKDEYKNDKSTGKRIIAGFSSIKYKVQIVLNHWRDMEMVDEVAGTQGFGFTIADCSQNAALANTYLAEPDNNWLALGMLVYPNSSPADWL